MIIPNLSVNPVVSISQLKQNSQLVIDWLTHNDKPIILIQGSTPVGVISPYRSQSFDPEILELRKKKVKELRKLIEDEWGDTNLNTVFDPNEVDKYTF